MEQRTGLVARAATAIRSAVAGLVGTGSPAAAARGGRRSRGRRDEAISAIPPHVVQIFQSAASTGDTSRQAQLYKDARVYDSRLDAVCATRVLAIEARARDILFKPPPGFESDSEARKIATHVARLWNNTSRTKDAIGHLAHSLLEGYAGLAQEWVVDGSTGLYRTEFDIENSVSPLFVFDPDTCEPWFNADRGPRPTKATDRAFPLSDRPDGFIFLSPTAGRADDPWRRGALRACVIRSLLKRMNIGHWSALLERWGQPQIVAVVDYDLLQSNDSDDKAVEQEALDALQAIGRDWRATVPKGIEFKEIPVSVASDLHKLYVDWANIEDAVAILGQNLSTEVSGGSYAAASAHNRVRLDILTSDCQSIAEALTDQWIAPIVQANWPGAPVPYAEFVIAPRTEFTLEDAKARACTVDEYRTGKGQEAEPDGRGSRYLTDVATMPSAGSGGAPKSEAVEPAKPSDTGEPGPSKPDAAPPGASPAPAPEATGDVQVAEVDKAADAALNGAQVASLMGIVEKVAQGAIPRETGIELITSAFPIDREKAEKIMGTVGAGFVPAATE